MTINERDIVLAKVKRQMDKSINDMRSELDRRMFAITAFYGNLKVKPIPKWKKVYYKVHTYFHTLWLAIKGTELEIPYED